jgi:RecT family
MEESEMTDALTLRANQPMGITEWTTLREQATLLLKSGFLPSTITRPEQAVAIAMLARELDVPLWAGFATINVIQGKPTVSPQLMLGLIYRSGVCERIAITEETEVRCTVAMKRKGQAAHSETFTLEDAKKLGLVGKDNWNKQPKIMLRWRAVAACARVVFPDIILGLYLLDEMRPDAGMADDLPVTVESQTVMDPRTGEMTYEAVEWSFQGAPPVSVVTDQTGPCTDEQWRRYTQLVDQAAEAGIDTSSYLFEREELSRARIIEIGTKLRAELAGATSLVS